MNILITGGNGFLGSELAVIAKKVYADSTILTPTKEELDLLDYNRVSNYFSSNKIDKVFHCAGRVSGIFGHTQSEDLYVNTLVGLNTIRAANRNDVRTFVNVGSTCIYPKYCKAPVDESQLFNGVLEPTCSGMALGKLACIQYINGLAPFANGYMTVMPPNIYGPGELVKPNGNHCILDIMIKLHEAKVNNDPELELPGTGSAVRSFMHVQDCAMAIIWCEQHNTDKVINIGSNIYCSIKELTTIIADVVGYTGKVSFTGITEEDGHPDKSEDITKFISGCKYYNPTYCVPLREGIQQLYNYYLIVNNEC